MATGQVDRGSNLTALGNKVLDILGDTLISIGSVLAAGPALLYPRCISGSQDGGAKNG